MAETIETNERNTRKVREGLVVSNKMDKTAVVAVTHQVRHPRYRKTVRRTSKFYVHDEENTLKVGDKVQAKYSTALSVRLVKKGSGAAYKRETTDTASRDAGNKPGAAAMRQVNFAADITKLDPVTGALTVKGPAGRVVDLKVKDPSILKGYVVGDQIEGTFLEVLAIGVHDHHRI